MQSTIKRILDKLEGVRSNEKGWQAKCPAHDDAIASLSAGVGEDGRVLLHCHAGCNVADICEAIGLEKKDLFPRDRNEKSSVSRRIVATYDYRDEQGDLLFQAVRQEPKKFFQRRPNGSGGWCNNLKEVRRVLYRLSELQSADPAQFVHIVEGEKDANRLAELGLVATTNPQGAGKWRNEYSDVLAGRGVTIIPDNDDAGRKHAQAVARSLSGKANSVKIVQLPDLPPKGDISDWLDRGGTVEELLRLVDNTENFELEVDVVDACVVDDSTPYRSTPTGMIYLKATNNGPVPVLLTNFTANIVADVVYDDGVESSHTFEIEACLREKTKSFNVPASKFGSMFWGIENLGAGAMIFAGASLKDHARAALQSLSRLISERHVFPHTGWREIMQMPARNRGGGRGGLKVRHS